MNILQETLRGLQVECEVQKKLKKDLEERNDFLLSELVSLRLVFSQSLRLILRLMPLIKLTPVCF